MLPPGGYVGWTQLVLRQSETRNRLVARLAEDDYAFIAPHVRRVDLQHRETLHQAGVAITAVYFPESGYASMLAILEDGGVAEVGMVGSEGLIGTPIIFGSDRSNVEALIQLSGAALRVDADTLRDALEKRPALRALLLRYTMTFGFQVTMTAVCNIHHLLEQRLARWLLMAHDRCDGDEFPMTHEYLSMMLGVRRAGVSVAARSLQRAGLIRYERGRVQMLNRRGLEAAACECHRIVSQESARILGYPTAAI